jgi:hypothetical protein
MSVPVPRYRVYLRDHIAEAYLITAELDDWETLTLVRRLNRTGTFKLVISAESIYASLINRLSGIVVTRDDTTIFSGQISRELTKTKHTITAVGTDDMVLLDVPTRPVPTTALAPFADDYDIRTGVASTLIYALVRDNIANTAPPFWRIPALVLAGDPIIGSTITTQNAFEPLGDVLYGAAISGGGLRYDLLHSDLAISQLDFTISAPVDQSETAKFGTEIGLTPLETQSITYGIDYELGDIATVVVEGEVKTDLIREIEISLLPRGGARITPMIADPGGTEDDPLVGYVQAVRKRLDIQQQNANIPPGSVGTTSLANDAVTAAKLADDAVLSNNIAAGQVGSSELATGAAVANIGFTPARITTGSYTGDGNATKDINIGFTPSFVMVSRTGKGAWFYFISGRVMEQLYTDTATELTTPIITNGFRVIEPGNNENAQDYQYVAIG